MFAKCSGYGYIIDGHKKSPSLAKVRAFLVQLEIFYDAAISRRLKPNNKGEVPIGFNFKQLKTVLQHHKS
jgi:hypothetical protein